MKESETIALNGVSSIRMLGTTAVWVKLGYIGFVDDNENC
jgi:hypothetical protein